MVVVGVPCVGVVRDIVRKKAVMALQRFFQLDSSSVAGMSEVVRRSLCDKDPSVMGATLHILFDLCKQDPSAYKDLVPSFVSILKQIIGMRSLGGALSIKHPCPLACFDLLLSGCCKEQAW